MLNINDSNNELTSSIKSTNIVYYEVFKDHWKQILSIFNKTQINDDDLEIFKNNIDQMILLLINNQHQNNDNNNKCLIDFIIDENIFNNIYIWSLNIPLKYTYEIKLYQLNYYELILNHLTQEDLILLFKSNLHKPLFLLLSNCTKHKSDQIEKHLISILNQLCVCLNDNHDLINILFDLNTFSNKSNSFIINSTSIEYNKEFNNSKFENGQSKFLIFSLLIPYIHQDNYCGKFSSIIFFCNSNY